MERNRADSCSAMSETALGEGDDPAPFVLGQAERGGEVGCRVGVHRQDAPALRRGQVGELGRQRGLADAPLAADRELEAHALILKPITVRPRRRLEVVAADRKCIGSAEGGKGKTGRLP
jgi:hypothetical protein